ncbi:MAG: succinate dehydrogenase, cytochrome b556 subunit [Rhodospirillales bacterium]|jgi:succinate dehydrogenase / fumarate reductase, cytochrome b subunit|nr:succinate dehydrogenase, cytochrome b556 subunit [Rhodospirillales bacterium]MBT4628452.1 succinate dehydrogenase, cytochrome b556 subunit [Rhodospirillales bacterium]MBT5353410.1 succinate dehydrogenase, cytochrome b556 subunit [Rhodospirillales bacterium]MBT5519214.1 succinate dehydrogenase, cytochrome b556 subunit [Rhodospirillales bacterium]MBT6111586.1 succinate dehydrogenase, cytochrome b556 subunit [Rhodospirillales bacterium]
MAAANRPLSPHLQVYRPQITSFISIMHRLTGVAMAFGTILFTYWLASAAYGAEAFERAQSLMGSWFGLVVLLGFTFSIYFHFANGIRHLFWDVGKGYEMETVRKTGWLVAIFAIVATVATWATVCPWIGGA